MKSWYLYPFVFTGMLLLHSTDTQAQQRVAVSSQSANAAESVLNKPVTVHLERMPLTQAVHAIAERAGVRLFYRAELLERTTTAVTLDAKSQPLGAVLDRALLGTSLRAVAVSHDVITLRSTAVTEQGAGQGVVTGRVVNAKTKQPVAGARIFVNDVEQSVQTGNDGSFRIAVAAGTKSIQIRAVGFTRQIRNVTVSDTDVSVLEFTLDPSASVLDEVVVTGTVIATARKEIPTPITVITAEEIQKRNITRIDQFFRGEVPGVIALEKGSSIYQPVLGAAQQSEVYSRGGSDLNGKASPLKTYIDGVEIYDAQYLGTIDVQSIERIEIITGPQAATIYGSGAIGGVMQIFTKRGSMTGMPEIRLTARYGMLENNLSAGRTPTHNDVLNVTGGSGGAFSYSSSASYNYSGQWQPLMFNRSYSFSLGATHRVGPVTADGSFSVMHGETGTGNAPGARSMINNGERERGFELFGWNAVPTILQQKVNKSNSQNSAFNANHRITRLWSQSLTLGRSGNAFRLVPLQPLFETPADTAVTHERQTGSRTAWGYNLSFVPSLPRLLSFTSVIGLNGSTTEGMRLSGGRPTADGGPLTTTVNASVDPDVSSWGGFGTWRVGLFRQLYFTLGMRLESNPAYGKDVKFDFTPTNGLAWTIEHGDMTLKLLGSYGKATRAPDAYLNRDSWIQRNGYNPSYVQSRVGNPNLTPEYETGPQGGFELFWGNLGSVSLNVYKGRVTDLIQLVARIDSTYLEHLTVPSASMYEPMDTYLNVATIKKHGIESSASVNLGPISLRGSYSWNDSRVQYVHPQAQMSYILNWYPGKSWKNVPTHTGSLNVGYSRGKISVSSNTSFIGGRSGDLQMHPFYAYIPQLRLGMYREFTRRGLGSLREYSIAGYNKTDAVIQYTINAWSSFSLNMTNVGNSFGSEIESSYYWPALGRTTVMGISLRYPRFR